MKYLILILASFSLVSCASYFKKKECNKTNWFAHGQKVALKGKRLDEDSYLKECKKVGSDINYADLDVGFKKGMAQYCTIQGATDTGREGDFLNLDLCEYSKHKKLKEAHRKGVLDFCTPNKAYSFAVMGGIYNNICPKKLEPAFMASFNRGRKEFLRLEIERRQQRIAQLGRDIRDLERERRMKYSQLRSLPSSKVVKRVKDASAAGGYRTEVSEADHIKDQRDDLQRDIDRIAGRISSAKREQRQLSNEIADTKRELRSIR